MQVLYNNNSSNKIHKAPKKTPATESILRVLLNKGLYSITCIFFGVLYDFS